MKSRILKPLQIRILVSDQAHRKDGAQQSKDASKALNGRTVYTLARQGSRAWSQM
jgi:hypothetical protein